MVNNIRMLFAHKSLAAMLADKNQGPSSTKKYGVHLNEQKKLLEVEDHFDATGDVSPNPPIAEELLGYTPFAMCQSVEGDFMVNQMAYNQFMPGYTIVCYGKRRSGKTVFVRNLCQRQRQHYKDVIVFTKTKSSCEYHKFLPNAVIIEGLDEDLLFDILADQKEKNRKSSLGEEMGNYKVLVILDDCMSENLRYKHSLDDVFFEGRHSDVSIIVCLQDIKGVLPGVANNIDMAVVFKLEDKRTFDTIRERFCAFLGKDQLWQLLNSDTFNQKHHFYCFDRAHIYNSIDHRVSYGCVDMDKEEDFVMGDRALWEEDMEQLKDLGFKDLVTKEDWGIVQ